MTHKQGGHFTDAGWALNNRFICKAFFKNKDDEVLMGEKNE